MLPFSFACLCDAKEMTGLGSLRLLTCLGKLHVTSAPGDFLTKKEVTHSKVTYIFHSDYRETVFTKLLCP